MVSTLLMNFKFYIISFGLVKTHKKRLLSLLDLNNNGSHVVASYPP